MDATTTTVARRLNRARGKPTARSVSHTFVPPSIPAFPPAPNGSRLLAPSLGIVATLCAVRPRLLPGLEAAPVPIGSTGRPEPPRSPSSLHSTRRPSQPRRRRGLGRAGPGAARRTGRQAGPMLRKREAQRLQAAPGGWIWTLSPAHRPALVGGERMPAPARSAPGALRRSASRLTTFTSLTSRATEPDARTPAQSAKTTTPY